MQEPNLDLRLHRGQRPHERPAVAVPARHHREHKQALAAYYQGIGAVRRTGISAGGRPLRRRHRRPPSLVRVAVRRHRLVAVGDGCHNGLARTSARPRVHSRPAPTTPSYARQAMADDEELAEDPDDFAGDDEDDEEPNELVEEPLEEDLDEDEESSTLSWRRTPRRACELDATSRKRRTKRGGRGAPAPGRVGGGGRGRRRPRRSGRRRGRSRHDPQGPPRRGRGHPGRGRGGGRAGGAGRGWRPPPAEAGRRAAVPVVLPARAAHRSRRAPWATRTARCSADRAPESRPCRPLR